MTPGFRVEIRGVWPISTPKKPSLPGTTTMSTCWLSSRRSGDTSSKVILPGGWISIATASPALRRFGGELLALLDRLLDGADHVEGAFRQIVILAGDQALEAFDRVLELDEHAGRAGEDLGDMEGLRQEALDLAGAGDDELVVLAELVHAEDGNDVLQRFVGLQHALHVAGDLVMLLADDARVEHAAGRIERIDRGIDAKLGDLARQHGRRVEMREGGGRRRIGEVV